MEDESNGERRGGWGTEGEKRDVKVFFYNQLSDGEVIISAILVISKKNHYLKIDKRERTTHRWHTKMLNH